VDNFVDRAREGRGKGNTLKIFPGSPKLAGKKERGFRGKEFLPACPAEQDREFCPPQAAGN